MKFNLGRRLNAPSLNSLILFLTSLSSSNDVKLLNVSGDKIFNLLKLKSKTSSDDKP